MELQVTNTYTELIQNTAWLDLPISVGSKSLLTLLLRVRQLQWERWLVYDTPNLWDVVIDTFTVLLLLIIWLTCLTFNSSHLASWKMQSGYQRTRCPCFLIKTSYTNVTCKSLSFTCEKYRMCYPLLYSLRERESLVVKLMIVLWLS